MSKTINIQVTLDAQGIMRQYPSPSKDQNNPTGIAHSFGYMVATSNTISGSGTGDLTFSANVGDVVRFFGVTASNNFENSALIYGINKFSGTQVFSEFESKTFTKSGVSPSGRDVLPADISDQKFWFFEADVINKGTEGYRVVFSLYSRDDSGQPVLFGYFQWDPTIQVAG
ncbi:hypothetical protein GCM10011344_47880 [Dokdonia pacifica]|uniref:Inclusion body protein n=1 Tax=Dokdonia pacifica TaxID=1627892 RepID=A0A239DWP5_9FLAO|nr:inclusion body family protein [Dokdonia pacifica]GGG41374.1 hypothetical protein GCM10011344_47880 [Dokdonia pacifica]SNS36699.1 Inclusion body protein [Dokdonia pacifica]